MFLHDYLSACEISTERTLTLRDKVCFDLSTWLVSYYLQLLELFNNNKKVSAPEVC